MKKFLIKENNIVSEVELGFDQIVEMFNGYIRSSVYKNNIKKDNQSEFDDLYQECLIECWRAYLDYDIKYKVLFVTYLTPKLRKAFAHSHTSLNAQKRKGDFNKDSLDRVVMEDDGDGTLLSVLVDETVNVESIIEYNELIHILSKRITLPIEKDMYKIIISKEKGDLEIFRDKYEFSRMGAYKKIERFRKELESLIKKEFKEIF